jgi:hypothetical protein
MTVQKMVELRITSVLHPPFSPDIAPFEFDLFGYLKDQLRKREDHNEGNNFEQSQKLYVRFLQTLLGIFVQWMGRFEQVLQTNGNSVSNNLVK